LEYLIYCNTDVDGNIIESIDGIRIIPDKQYEHFFFKEKEIDLMQYKVKLIDGKAELVKKGAE